MAPASYSALPSHSRSVSLASVASSAASVSSRFPRRIVAALALVATSACSLLLLGSTLFPAHLAAVIPSYPHHALSPLTAAPPVAICSRTLLYRFAGSHGFASEFLIFLRVALLAEKYNYTLFIDDSRWNYGSWDDYFLPLTTDCASPDNLYKMHRTALAPHTRDPPSISATQYPFWTGSQHVVWSNRKLDYLDSLILSSFVNSTALEHLHEQDILTWPAKKPLGGSETVPEVFRPVFTELSQKVKALWRLNAEMSAKMDGIDVVSTESSQTIGAHVRLGDKSGELAQYGPHVFQKPKSTLGRLRAAWLKHYKAAKAMVDSRSRKPKAALAENTDAQMAGISDEEVDNFMKAVGDLARPATGDIDSTVLTGKPVLILMSDDTSGEGLHKFIEHPSSAGLDVRTGIPLRAIPKLFSASPSESSKVAEETVDKPGFVEAAFNALPIDDRVDSTRDFLRDLTFLAERADALVFTASSNVGRLLGLLAGVEMMEAGKLRSTDVRWFPTVRYQ